MKSGELILAFITITVIVGIAFSIIFFFSGGALAILPFSFLAVLVYGTRSLFLEKSNREKRQNEKCSE